MLQLIAPAATDLICISGIQPYAFSPARSVCRRLRSHFPSIRIVVGIWGFTGDRKRALARFERNSPDRLFVSFEQVIEYIREPEKDAPAGSVSIVEAIRS